MYLNSPDEFDFNNRLYYPAWVGTCFAVQLGIFGAGEGRVSGLWSGVKERRRGSFWDGPMSKGKVFDKFGKERLM